jgi:hypothetical protein
MKSSFVRTARTKNPDAATCWPGTLLLLLLGSSSLLLQGGHRGAEQRLKNTVLGSWEEVRGTKETLQFNLLGNRYDSHRLHPQRSTVLSCALLSRRCGSKLLVR